MQNRALIFQFAVDPYFEGIEIQLRMLLQNTTGIDRLTNTGTKRHTDIEQTDRSPDE
jgi:hypothetical protein